MCRAAKTSKLGQVSRTRGRRRGARGAGLGRRMAMTRGGYCPCATCSGLGVRAVSSSWANTASPQAFAAYTSSIGNACRRCAPRGGCSRRRGSRAPLRRPSDILRTHDARHCRHAAPSRLRSMLCAQCGEETQELIDEGRRSSFVQLCNAGGDRCLAYSMHRPLRGEGHRIHC